MRHYLRDLGKLIHEPGWHAQLRAQVTRSSEQLTQKLGRAPRPEEIASSLDIQPQIVRKVLESNNLLSVASLMPKVTMQMAKAPRR
jgi:RNA polymerase sigma-B factor